MFDAALAPGSAWTNPHVHLRRDLRQRPRPRAQRRPVLLRPLRRARHLLGNIREPHMLDLVASPQQTASATPSSTPCRVLPRLRRPLRLQRRLPANRFTHTPDGEPGLNYLCAGYKTFFHHVDEPMRQMAELLRRGAGRHRREGVVRRSRLVTGLEILDVGEREARRTLADVDHHRLEQVGRVVAPRVTFHHRARPGPGGTRRAAVRRRAPRATANGRTCPPRRRSRCRTARPGHAGRHPAGAPPTAPPPGRRGGCGSCRRGRPGTAGGSMLTSLANPTRHPARSSPATVVTTCIGDASPSTKRSNSVRSTPPSCHRVGVPVDDRSRRNARRGQARRHDLPTDDPIPVRPPPGVVPRSCSRSASPATACG